MSTGALEQTACVRIELENRSENVALIRAALSGLAEAAGLDEELDTDLKTAVSEACNNVVIHAYEGGPGPLRVLLQYERDRIDVIVRDDGVGIRRLSGPGNHMGLGLALISALADQAEFRSPPGGGTEVRMRFRHAEVVSEAGFPGDDDWPQMPPTLAGGDVVIWFEPVALLRHIFGRIARAAAASAHFTMTGASALYNVNDAVAGYAEAAVDGHLVMAISGRAHALSFDAGPFVTAGAPGANAEVAGSEDLLAPRRARLAEVVDQLSFEQYEEGNLLRLLLRDRGHDSEG